MRHGSSGARSAVMLLALLWPIAPASSQPSDLASETVVSTAIRLDFETVDSHAGWYLIGSAPEHYRIGKDVAEGIAGRFAGFLQACDSGGGSGALERTISALAYRDKRIRITGRINTRHSGPGMVFYAASQTESMATLRARGKNLPFRTDWQSVELVMDVPPAAASIEIGLSMRGGRGATIWLESVTVEVVDETVPIAGGVVPVWLGQRELNDVAVSCDGHRY